LNKADRIESSRIASLRAARPGAVVVSARSGQGLQDLSEILTSRLDLVPRSVRLRFRKEDARSISSVYAVARVTAHEVQGDDVRLDAEVPGRLLERFRGHLI